MSAGQIATINGMNKVRFGVDWAATKKFLGLLERGQDLDLVCLVLGARGKLSKSHLELPVCAFSCVATCLMCS